MNDQEAMGEAGHAYLRCFVMEFDELARKYFKVRDLNVTASLTRTWHEDGRMIVMIQPFDAIFRNDDEDDLEDLT